MSENLDFADLLSQTRIAKLRPLLEGRVCEVDRFVSAFLRTMPGGLAQLFTPGKKEENLLFIRRLIELFHRIDCFGKGSITWEQFTSFAAENTISGTGLSNKAIASVVYRENEKLFVPNSDTLPTTPITCLKWVPELQQLFVTYEEYTTLFVFNHLCRLIAKVHANVPPADATLATNLVSQKAKEEVSDKYRARVNAVDALRIQKVEQHEHWSPVKPIVKKHQDDEDDDDHSPHGSDDENKNNNNDSLNDRPTAREMFNDDKINQDISNDPEVSWAMHVMRQKANVAPGERMQAAQILANARCTAEARKAALLAELGAHVGKHKASLTIKEQRALEDEIRRQGRGPMIRQAGADAAALERSRRELVALRAHQAQLMNSVRTTVSSRQSELSIRRNYAVERAMTRNILLSHPAGFTTNQADRLMKLSVKDLGEAGDKMLPIMGVKNAGVALWGKAAKMLSKGSTATSNSTAALTDQIYIPGGDEDDHHHGHGRHHTKKSDGPTIAEVTGGKPQAAASAAMIAYDPGPTGKTRDFGYLADSQPQFSYNKVKASRSKASGLSSPGSKQAQQVVGSALLGSTGSMTSVKEVGKDGATALSRIETLALPRGNHPELSLLAVEYCMPVDRKIADDPKAWRQIANSDVRHLIAVSSSELVITLWTTRGFEYAGVIHVLLPQDRILWSTGANLLVTCNTFVGPISCWDILSGSKVCSLNKHTQPIQALVDVSSLGCFCSGGLDGIINVWTYRSDSDALGGELAGIRGRSAPKIPEYQCTLSGHTTGVMLMTAVDDSIAGRVISVALGSEICIWDMTHMMLLARLSNIGKEASINALALTDTKPPYAITVDETNMIRLWNLEVGDGQNSVIECLDMYRLQDMPNNGVTHVLAPRPHPNIICGGRRLLLLGPSAPNVDDTPGGGPAGISAAGFLVPIAAQYSEAMGLILVAEGDGITVFDARTGERKRRFPQLLPQILVSLTLDGSGRKALCGDAGGDIVLFNVLDGRILAKATPSHKDDVTRIIPLKEDGLIITCSWDRSIRVYDLNLGRETGREKDIPCIRIVENAHAADITCMDVSRALGLVVTGATDGTVRVWDLCTFDLLAVLVGHENGITSVAFPGPSAIPIVVTADDGGNIFLWAVRGSRYVDRLMLGLRNMGKPSGPPPPNMRVVDLAALKSEERRRKVAVTKGGLVMMQTFKAGENHMNDKELSTLFKARQTKVEHGKRHEALTGTIAHAVDVSLNSKAPEGEDDLPPSPVEHTRSPSPHKRTMRSSSPSPTRSLSPGKEKEGVLVPVTALQVYCAPATTEEELDNDEDNDETTGEPKIVFKIFSGDSQGVLKQWDISSHINRFAKNNITGINILPPSRLVYNQNSYNPRQTKHRVYPDENPAAFDPEVEAAKAAAALAAKRISSIGRKDAKAVSEDAIKNQVLLARLRMQRTYRNSSNKGKSPSKFDPKTLNPPSTSLAALEREALAEAKARGELDVKVAIKDVAESSPLALHGTAVTSKRPSTADSKKGTTTNSNSDPNTHTQHGLSYPKVKAFLGGAVVYAKMTMKAKLPPLIPIFVRPLPDKQRKLIGHLGMDTEDSPVKPTVPPFSLSIKKPEDESGPHRNEVGTPFSPFCANVDPTTIRYTAWEDIPPQVQDDIWYTFTSDAAEYTHARASIQTLAEEAGRANGWEVEVDEDGIPIHHQTKVASASGKRRLFSKHQVHHTQFQVPNNVWVASRIRPDIRPQSTWTGHTDICSNISIIPDPFSLMTCSLDGSVRLWTPNGLPVAVVSAPARNIELERAMAAAQQAISEAGGSNGDDNFKIVHNLTKQDTPWQFIPNDENNIEYASKQAQLVWARLTTMKHGRRTSISLTSDIHIPVETVTQNPNINTALATVYSMGRRASLMAAEQETVSNKFLLAAQAATVAAEGMTIKSQTKAENFIKAEQQKAEEEKERQSMVTPTASTARSNISTTAAPAPAPTVSANTDALIPKSIVPIPDLSDFTDDRAKEALDNALVSAIRNWEKETEFHPTKNDKPRADPLRLLPIPTVTVTSRSPSPDGSPGHGRRLSETEMLRKYPNMGSEVQANSIKAAKESGDKVGGISRKDAVSLGILSRTMGIDEQEIEEKKGDEQFHTLHHVRPQTASRPSSAAHRGSISRPQTANPNAMTPGNRRTSGAIRPTKEAIPTVNLELVSGLQAAMSFVYGPNQSSNILASPIRPPSAQSQRPGTAPASSLTRPESAGFVSKLRVSAAAAKAGTRMDELLATSISSSDNINDTMVMNATNRRSSRLSTLEKKDEEKEAEIDQAQAEHDKKLEETLSRARSVISGKDSLAVHVQHRRRADDILAEAIMTADIAKQGGTTAALMNNWTESASRPGTRGGDGMDLDGERPGTASGRSRSRLGFSMTNNRTASPPPPGLHSFELTMWPYRDYVPPKTFAMYTRAQIERFRSVWNSLDQDRSGSVDVEEILNAKVFSVSTLKVTKAVFASIDSDKSGDVSLGELSKVAFAMATPDIRREIVKYMKYLDACDLAAIQRTKFLEDESANSMLGHGTSGIKGHKAGLDKKTTSIVPEIKKGPSFKEQQIALSNTGKDSARSEAAIQAIETSRTSRNARLAARKALSGDDLAVEDM